MLVGGSTLFTGMKERVKKDVQSLCVSSVTPDVEATADRKNLCWLGGAILSQIPKFDSMYITKKEWEEFGPQIVHRKCF